MDANMAKGPWRLSEIYYVRLGVTIDTPQL